MKGVAPYGLGLKRYFFTGNTGGRVDIILYFQKKSEHVFSWLAEI
jgi:hypothetical protein